MHRVAYKFANLHNSIEQRKKLKYAKICKKNCYNNENENENTFFLIKFRFILFLFNYLTKQNIRIVFFSDFMNDVSN